MVVAGTPINAYSATVSQQVLPRIRRIPSSIKVSESFSPPLNVEHHQEPGRTKSKSYLSLIQFKISMSSQQYAPLLYQQTASTLQTYLVSRKRSQ